MTRINPRIRGLTAFVLILVLVIGTPMLLIFIGATPWNVDWSQLRMLLLSPDDGTVALILIGIVAWLAWAVMTFCLISEVIAAARGVRAPRLPVIGTGQHLAAKLVAAAALLFTVAQPLAITFAAVPAHAQDQTPHDVRPAQAPATQSVPSAEPPRAVVSDRVELDPVSYTTRAHDSLWKIAETHLGDGARFTEIVALNPALFPNGPEFLAVGVVLQLPAPAADLSDPTSEVDEAPYVVEEGDTLWDIAEEELGDPTRYGEIFDASRATTQPDGAHLTDPDLIRPGWDLDIPDDAPPPEMSPELEVEPPAIPEEPPAVEPPTAEPTHPEASVAPQQVPDDTHADAAADATTAETPGWLLPGLTGAGSVLAGSLFLVLRGHRRRQMRYRYPGEVLAAPPAELADVEKTARLAESATVPRLEDLDRLLRHLAEGLELTRQPLPRLQTVEMASDLVTLHLAEEAPAPPGWTEHERSWTFTIEERLPEADCSAPFPLLAAVGQTSSGHLVLANLEELGCVRLTGDDAAAQALARSITAELTLSPWSVLADIDTIGIADEMADLDPLRLHHHASDDVAFLARLTQELTQQGDREPESLHAVVAISAVESDELAQSIAARHDRVGAALITVGGREHEHDVVFCLSDSRLLIHDLKLNLSPAGLTAAEAAATAALVSATRNAVTVPSPRNRASDPAWRAATDRSGALSMAYADAKPGSDDTLTVEEPDSPPTAETLAETSPIPAAPTIAIAEPLDPQLDSDLKAWFDEDCRLPRLHLLGPVRAQAHGDPAAVSRRKPHYVEMLTFLTLHPEGVTTKQIAEAFSINKDRVRVDVGIVRKWLGHDERTGHPHLPPAAQSRAAGEAGVWTYQVDDVLVDADLFRRLRARGQSRGVEGQDDFDTALRLVEGAPFSDLRETGWSWLLDADCRDDEILACAVVDVAHEVVTAALEDGALDRALNAVETARLAAPYDEVARVDLASVLIAQGHEDAAREFLANAVYNRTDDYLGPVELPPRTAAQLRRVAND